MVREIVKQGNEFLNAFGTKDSISDGLSPRNIIDNLPHVDNNNLKYVFGQYVQLHVTEKLTNTMKSRTIGAIVLGPQRIQGQYNYMSLETGEKIDGRVIVILPITDDVINRIESFGKAQSQPFRASHVLQYEWRPGQAMDVDNGDFNVEEGTNNNLLVPASIEQHVQDPNPFAILAYDDDGNDNEEVRDVDNHDNENVAVLPDHFENQGADNSLMNRMISSFIWQNMQQS